MGFLTKLDNGWHAFKSAFGSSEVPPYYARLEDGTHSYNYETTQFGLLGLLGLGSPFYKAKENLKYYYKTTMFVQDCINLYADFASQVRIQEVDQNGNAIENSEYVNFLQHPNAFQNGTDFLKEMVINYLSCGAVFQYGNFFKNGNLRVSPQLYNLDYCLLAFPEVKDRYSLSRKDIQELTIKEKLADSKVRSMKLYELAYFYDTIPNNGFGDDKYDAAGFFKPMARMFSVMSSINTLLNTQSSMSYMSGNNVNFMLSKKPLTNGSVAPLASDQKDDIERKVNGRGKYGTRSDKVGDTIATNESIDLLNMTRDNRKMQMIEMQENAKENVRNCFLIPKDFFGDSTYENKQMSEARFILGQVKTITDNWLEELTAKTPGYFEVRGTKLVGTYDHLPSIAETKDKLANEGFLARTEAMLKAMDVYDRMVLITPGLTWKEFLRINQFNDHLMIQS